MSQRQIVSQAPVGRQSTQRGGTIERMANVTSVGTGLRMRGSTAGSTGTTTVPQTTRGPVRTPAPCGEVTGVVGVNSRSKVAVRAWSAVDGTVCPGVAGTVSVCASVTSTPMVTESWAMSRTPGTLDVADPLAVGDY